MSRTAGTAGPVGPSTTPGPRQRTTGPSEEDQ